jgi:hypothetical protein
MRTTKFASTAIFTMCSLALLWILFLNGERVITDRLFPYFFLLLFSFVVLIFVLKVLKFSEKYALVIFIVLSLAFRLSFSLLANPQPVSDFSMIFHAAEKVAFGDFTFQESTYFQTWAYQTGFVVYEALVIKIFGLASAKVVLIILNCFYVTGTNVLIYLIARKLTSDHRCSLLAGALYLFYPASYFLAPVLTNQHLAAFIFLYGIYCIIITEKTSQAKHLWAGLLIAIGNIIHPIGIVILVSLLFYFGMLIVNAISQKNRAGAFSWSLKAGTTSLLYFAVISLAAVLVVTGGINRNGLSNREPLWKFVVGINEEHGGAYSDDLAESVFSQIDKEERRETEIEMIKQGRPQSLERWRKFLDSKTSYMWAAYENIEWAFGEEAMQGKSAVYKHRWDRVVSVLRGIDKVYYLFLWFFAFVSLAGMAYFSWKGAAPYDPKAVLLCLVFLLYFGIHLFIEVQTRYRYFAMPLICLMAAVQFPGYHLSDRVLTIVRRRAAKEEPNRG